MAVSPVTFDRANQDWTREITPVSPRSSAAPSGDWMTHPVSGAEGTGGEGAGQPRSTGGNTGNWNAGGMENTGNADGSMSNSGSMNSSGGSGAMNSGGMNRNGGYMNIIGKDIENNLPPGEIGAPDSLEEVFRGSMKALLLRNIGNYIVATFLIGTQGTVSWEGILYDVGNDYLAIYQTGRDQYIVSDLYSLKYVEFYDTRRREMCDAILSHQG